MPSDRKHFSKTKPMELKHFDVAIAWWNDRKEIVLEDGIKAQKCTVDFLLREQGFQIVGNGLDGENYRRIYSMDIMLPLTRRGELRWSE